MAAFGRVKSEGSWRFQEKNAAAGQPLLRSW